MSLCSATSPFIGYDMKWNVLLSKLRDMQMIENQIVALIDSAQIGHLLTPGPARWTLSPFQLFGQTFRLSGIRFDGDVQIAATRTNHR